MRTQVREAAPPLMACAQADEDNIHQGRLQGSKGGRSSESKRHYGCLLWCWHTADAPWRLNAYMKGCISVQGTGLNKELGLTSRRCQSRAGRSASRAWVRTVCEGTGMNWCVGAGPCYFLRDWVVMSPLTSTPTWAAEFSLTSPKFLWGAFLEDWKSSFTSQAFMGHPACSRHSSKCCGCRGIKGNQSDTISIKLLNEVTTSEVAGNQSELILTFIMAHNPSETVDS